VAACLSRPEGIMRKRLQGRGGRREPEVNADEGRELIVGVLMEQLTRGMRRPEKKKERTRHRRVQLRTLKGIVKQALRAQSCEKRRGRKTRKKNHKSWVKQVLSENTPGLERQDDVTGDKNGRIGGLRGNQGGGGGENREGKGEYEDA